MSDDDGLSSRLASIKRRATTGKTARRLEYTAADVAATTFTEGQLFGIAKFISDLRLADVTVTDTTCGYCAVGCRFDIYAKDGEILGVRPNPEKAPINGISTCVKGKFGYGYVNSPDRLTQPLINEDGTFRIGSWDEALERVATGLRRIQTTYGTDAVSVISSSRATNEDNYVMQKFARQVLNTNNIDNCNRLCHAATVAGLSQSVGYGAASSGLAAIESTDCYLITGSNTTEAHPVLATKIKQNVVHDDATLIVVDPRRVQIAEYADQYCRIEPGYDATWINGMIRHIITNELYDEAFVERRTNGFDELRASIDQFTPSYVEAQTGFPADALIEAAETIANAETVTFCWTLGLVEHTHGTENVLAMANLALITGNVGEPRNGLCPFRGQNNVQGGGGDMGPLPDSFPGYQPVTDPTVREKFATAWGMESESLPDTEGLRTTEQFLAADSGDIRGMFIQGENPAISEPNTAHAESVLEELEFLVVQDLFLTDTAKHADVVLPATSTVESRGTYTASSRHVQLLKPAIDPIGDAKPDWKITQLLAETFGYQWEYDSPAEIMDEIAALTPIYGGISHDRLEQEPLQWPCWDDDHPGTPYLYADSFPTADGKAQLHPATPVEPAETPTPEFPLVLTSGRVLYQYHTGTMTRRTEGMTEYSDGTFLEMHPETAREHELTEGERVRVTSRHGSTISEIAVTDRPRPDTVFMPMHYLHGGANALTKAEPLDEPSRAPAFKVTPVTVEPAPADD